HNDLLRMRLQPVNVVGDAGGDGRVLGLPAELFFHARKVQVVVGGLATWVGAGLEVDAGVGNLGTHGVRELKGGEIATTAGVVHTVLECVGEVHQAHHLSAVLDVSEVVGVFGVGRAAGSEVRRDAFDGGMAEPAGQVDHGVVHGSV